jgi:hypothetical protein
MSYIHTRPVSAFKAFIRQKPCNQLHYISCKCTWFAGLEHHSWCSLRVCGDLTTSSSICCCVLLSRDLLRQPRICCSCSMAHHTLCSPPPGVYLRELSTPNEFISCILLFVSLAPPPHPPAPPAQGPPPTQPPTPPPTPTPAHPGAICGTYMLLLLSSTSYYLLGFPSLYLSVLTTNVCLCCAMLCIVTDE